jgi:NADH-quinone oxidoreductase subunit N
MTGTDLLALLPLLSVTLAALVVLLLIAFWRRHLAVNLVTCLGLTVALAALLSTAAVIPHDVMALLRADAFGLLYMALLLGASLVVAIQAYDYLNGRDTHPEEFYLLLLLATLGGLVLVMSTHFVTFFLGLEILSVAFYALLAYLRLDGRPLEAGVKYLLLAAASAAFLLFGMALLYAELGTMAFPRLAAELVAGDRMRSGLVLTGLAMIFIGVGFKLAVVPFHMWTPDVYEGAPAPATAFIATVSKGAVVALLLRFIMYTGVLAQAEVWLIVSLIAIASMFVGNLLALWQPNLKRLLAYSSIAHLGYVLVALLAGGPRAVEAVTFYVVAYVVTTLCAFGCVTVLSGKDTDADAPAVYQGLFWRRPGVAVVLSAALLSLAGIPATAGFVGKFYVLLAGIESALWVLVLLVVLNSAIGLFYYLRLLVIMYAASMPATPPPPSPEVPAWSLASGIVLTALTLLLVWLGIYPLPFMAMIRLSVASLL